MPLNETLAYIEKNFTNTLEDLKTLVRIPSISFDGFDLQNVEKSASAVMHLLQQSGLDSVQILRLDNAHPYVYGEWLKAPGKPTVLLYAHHDVQPFGRKEIWQTDPFEPTLKEGPGGLRLYARGSADDKAGIIVHTAAIVAYLKTAQALPLNVKVLIEGEEEIGSPHLREFLQKHKDLVQADFIVLTDTANFDCGIPSLTIGLRGMVCLDVEVRALKKTIHSGLWGGPVPDAAMALSKILATLVDTNGEIAVEEIRKLIPSCSTQQRAYDEALPFDEVLFREQSGIIASACVHKNVHPYAKLWRLPTLAVNALQSSSRAQAGNTLNDVAWARISVRVAPGMDSQKVETALIQHLKQNQIWGVEVKIHTDALATPWQIDPIAPANKPAFDAVLLALSLGYNTKPVLMGCGATIPFVKPFAEALKGAPALLIGVEDPYTNAHGENESLLVSDFKSACLSQVHLFDQLAKISVN